MFFSEREATARQVGSTHAQLLALLAERDQWYDGSVDSIDQRLAAISRALAHVRHVATSDPAMLAEATKLEDEYRRLSALRRERLTYDGTSRVLPKVSTAAPLSARGRRLIAVEIRQFLAANADAVSDPEEMDVRAQDHAEIVTMQMPVTEARSVVDHFRLAVNWHLRNQPSSPLEPRTATRKFVANTVPDAALFD